jgi:hypothetical protein
VTHRKTEKERQLADGRGGEEVVGEEPNHTTAARKPGPLKIIHYSLVDRDLRTAEETGE